MFILVLYTVCHLSTRVIAGSGEGWGGDGGGVNICTQTQLNSFDNELGCHISTVT